MLIANALLLKWSPFFASQGRQTTSPLRARISSTMGARPWRQGCPGSARRSAFALLSARRLDSGSLIAAYLVTTDRGEEHQPPRMREARSQRPAADRSGGAPHRAHRDALERRSCRTHGLPVDLTLAGTRLNCYAIHKLHRPNPRMSSPWEI